MFNKFINKIKQFVYNITQCNTCTQIIDENSSNNIQCGRDLVINNLNKK